MSSQDRFAVSGWEEDALDIQEETTPHATPQKEILWAAENGKLELVKQLIQTDAALVHVVDKDGYTPLHRACYNNHLDVVLYLLQNGANILAKTSLGWQPLHSACQWNNTKCALMLLQNGADINATSEGGQTPLHIAASHGASHETVQLLLLDPYINPQILNNSNETAYDLAKRSSKFYNIFEMSALELNGIKES